VEPQHVVVEAEIGEAAEMVAVEDVVDERDKVLEKVTVIIFVRTISIQPRANACFQH
jgi:hypothetical protein